MYNLVEKVAERKIDSWHNREPIKAYEIFKEIALDFGACSPLEAAVGALLNIEAIPRYRAASAAGKNKPPEDPRNRQYEAARSYLTTLGSYQHQTEVDTLPANLAESNPDEDQNDPVAAGKLQAYEDLRIILGLLQAPGFSVSQN